MPFAGHPTVGAAALVAHLRAPQMLSAQDLRLVLEERVGDVVCVARHRRGQALAASFTLPRLPQELGPAPAAEEIAARLGLAPADIGFGDHRPVVYGAGTDFIFAPLDSVEALGRADPDVGRWGADNGPAIYCYAPGGDGVDYRARMFASGWGIAGPGDRLGRRRLRRRRHALHAARRRRTDFGHRAGRRDGPAEPHRAQPGGRARRAQRGDDRRAGGAGRRGNDRPVSGSRILSIDALDLGFAARPWPFAEAQAERIADHWRARLAEQPRLYNGRVLLLGRHAIGADRRGVTLSGEYFETDFAAFLAWRDFGFPDPTVANCFSMAALVAADGGFLLGEMAAHTANAGATYFPAGTPDPNDVFDGKVDLAASALRELQEETGIAADEVAFAPGWTVVYAPPRIACLKMMRLAEPAERSRRGSRRF